MRYILSLLTLLIFAAPACAAEPPIPAGTYILDKTHASLVFRVSHMGFSNYTAFFENFDVTLQFDPANPEASSVKAIIDPRSLILNSPPKGFTDDILGDKWLNEAAFPDIRFASTKVTKTGDKTARIDGDLSLHGITHPVSLDATFNGGYAGLPGMDPNARIGFSAHGTFKRSDFGVSYGIPAPGSNMGVGDNIDFTIEAEFTGPPLAAAK